MIQFLSCSGKGLPPKKLETNAAKTEDVPTPHGVTPGRVGHTPVNNYKRNKIDIDFVVSASG